MRCVPRPLRDARADLKAAKEYLRQYTYEKLARSPSRRPGDRVPGNARDKPRQQISPWDSDQGRGMVCRSDHYQVQQFLRRQARESRRLPAWPNAEGTSDPVAWQFHHVHGPETSTGLGFGTGHDRPRRGHPLG